MAPTSFIFCCSSSPNRSIIWTMRKWTANPSLKGDTLSNNRLVDLWSVCFLIPLKGITLMYFYSPLKWTSKLGHDTNFGQFPSFRILLKSRIRFWRTQLITTISWSFKDGTCLTTVSHGLVAGRICANHCSQWYCHVGYMDLKWGYP